jgi:hypothetical protein
MSRSQQVARDRTAGRRERRPAFFAGPEFRSSTQWGRERPHPRPQRLVQAAAPGGRSRSAAGVGVGANVRATVRVESSDLASTKTTTRRVPRTRPRTVSCRPSRAESSRCARRGQCLGAARRPRSVHDAASGIDRASAQCVVSHLRDGRLEWLTLTRDFNEAYSAGISLVSG